MRAFVAIDVPDPSGALGLGRGGEGAQTHLTLRFLGELAPERVDEVVEVLRALARERSPFRLTLSGIGAFPTVERPRVVFVEVVEGRQELEAIAEGVEDGLARIGFEREGRPFRPHVTVLRVRSPGDRERARRILERGPTGPFGETEVRELLLKSSALHRTGAEHRVVARVPFPPRAAAGSSDAGAPRAPPGARAPSRND